METTFSMLTTTSLRPRAKKISLLSIDRRFLVFLQFFLCREKLCLMDKYKAIVEKSGGPITVTHDTKTVIPVESKCPPPPYISQLKSGTILYHQRYNGVFKGGREKPYAPVNFFSRGPYYLKPNPGSKYQLNTYKYKVVKDIPMLLVSSEDNYAPDDITDWLQEIVPKDINAFSIKSYLPWLQKTYGINGLYYDHHERDLVGNAAEYRFPAGIVQDYLELVEKDIRDPTEPEVESGGDWPW
jgi:hypothetical protein